MKRFSLRPLLSIIFACGIGCSGGGSDPDLLAATLRDCGNTALLEFLSIFERLGDVVTDAQAPDLPHVITTPTANANEFDYVATYDLDADGTPETELAGVISFSAPPDELTNGDFADVTVTQTSSEVPAAEGSIRVNFVTIGAELSVSGTATLEGDENCETVLTISSASPLLITSGITSELAGDPSFNFVIFQLTGTVDADTTRGRGRFQSTIVLNGTNSLRFTNNALNNRPFASDVFVEYPTEGEFAAAASCAVGGIDGVDRVLRGFDALIVAVRVNAPTVFGRPYTFEPVAGVANTFTFSFEDEDATISGQIVFPTDPVGDPVDGVVTVSNWVSSTIGLAGGAVDARSITPLVLTLDNGSRTSYYGSSTLVNPVPECAVSVSIPATDPLSDERGEIRVVVTSQQNTFGATFHFASEQVTVTNGVIDNFLVPGVLLKDIVSAIFR